MSKYRILVAATPKELETKVNEYKDIGYFVTGGLVYAYDIWAQAVDCPKKKDKKDD